jgi:hypothetical protein
VNHEKGDGDRDKDEPSHSEGKTHAVKRMRQDNRESFRPIRNDQAHTCSEAWTWMKHHCLSLPVCSEHGQRVNVANVLHAVMDCSHKREWKEIQLTNKMLPEEQSVWSERADRSRNWWRCCALFFFSGANHHKFTGETRDKFMYVACMNANKQHVDTMA